MSTQQKLIDAVQAKLGVQTDERVSIETWTAIYNAIFNEDGAVRDKLINHDLETSAPSSEGVMQSSNRFSVTAPNKFFPSQTVWSVDGGLKLRTGSGFNTVIGSPGGQAVVYNDENDLETIDKDVTGKKTKYILDYASSYQEIMSKLNISAAASLGWGSFSSSVSHSMVETSYVTSYDIYLLVDIVVEHQDKMLKTKTLTKQTLNRLQAGYDDFLEFCGTDFIQGYTTGGRLSAVVRFTSTDRKSYAETRNAVEAAVKASELSGRGSAAFQSELSKLSKYTSMSVRMIRNGGYGDLPDLQSLSAASLAFPTDVSKPGGSVIIASLILPYSTADNWPLARHRKIDLQVVVDYANKMKDIIKQLMRAYQLRADAGCVLAQPYLFESNTQQTVQEQAQAAHKASQAEIDRLFIEYLKLQQSPTQKLSPMEELPQMKLSRAPVICTTCEPILELYEHAHFAGRKLETNESIPDLSLHGFDEIISSLKLRGQPGEYRLEIFEHPNFQGATSSFVGPQDHQNMDDHNFGASRQLWRLEREPRGPRETRNDPIRSNDKISSIRLTKIR